MCTTDLFASQQQTQLAARCVVEYRSHTPSLTPSAIHAKLWVSTILMFKSALNYSQLTVVLKPSSRLNSSKFG